MAKEKSPAVDRKMRFFCLVLIWYNDIKQAADISTYILERELRKGYPRKNRIMLQALNRGRKGGDRPCNHTLS